MGFNWGFKGLNYCDKTHTHTHTHTRARARALSVRTNGMLRLSKNKRHGHVNHAQ